MASQSPTAFPHSAQLPTCGLPCPDMLMHCMLLCLLQALVSALLMNIAIVGINQLSDIEIDKVSGSRASMSRVKGSRQLQEGASLTSAQKTCSLYDLCTP